MRFLSLFSGIEAASVAWEPIGWKCAGVAEIEKFPCAVLKQHYPGVPNLGDVTKITERQIKELGRIDLVVLGFPCQDLSVAGKRKGLKNADGSLTRSGLFFTAMQIVQWANPRWTVGENVPGLFSSNEGSDFATVVGELAGAEFDVPREGWRNTGVALGPKGLVEWAVLDAQYFGVPQRRRRVFFIRDSGNWSDRPPLLFERHSLQWHTPPSREARKGVAPTLSARTKGGGGLGTDFDLDGELITEGKQWPVEVTATLDTTMQKYMGYDNQHVNAGYPFFVPATAHALRGEGFDASEDGTGRGTPLVPCHAIQAGALRENPNSGPDGVGVQKDIAYTLEARAEVQAVAFSCKDHGADAGEISPTLRSMGHDGSHANAGGQVAVAFNLRGREGGAQPEVDPDNLASLRAASGGSSRSYVAQMAVRRLTPRECERLQGFPTVLSRAIISVCLDRRNNSARVDLRCLRLLSNASPVAENVRSGNAQSADVVFWRDQAEREALVAVHVRSSHEQKLHALRSLGKSICSANGASLSSPSLRPMPLDGIAPALAVASQELEALITTGKAVSPQSTNPFIVPVNGNWPAVTFGHESAENVSDATGAHPEDMKSTTSSRGLNIPPSGSTVETWLCFVLNVTTSFIPKGTPSASSFSAVIDVETDYTLITHKGKPSADGPRYKALGNSMAIPVVRWIGQRIQLVEEICSTVKTAG